MQLVTVSQCIDTWRVRFSRSFLSIEFLKTDLLYHIGETEENKKQNNLQGSRLFCSKGVLGLEINEVIRGITSFRIIYNVDGKRKSLRQIYRKKLFKIGTANGIFVACRRIFLTGSVYKNKK